MEPGAKEGYALATAHRLRAAGKRMSDATIIDAYERAYVVAQAVGADGRTEDIPRCVIGRPWLVASVATSPPGRAPTE